MADQPTAAASPSTPAKTALGAKLVLATPQLFVGAIVMFGFFGVVLIFCWHTVPPENRELLDTLIGFIGGAFTAVVAFYFGSTSSSHAKDATISNLAANAPPNTGAQP